MYQGNDIEEDEITLDHATPLQEMVSCVLHTANFRPEKKSKTWFIASFFLKLLGYFKVFKLLKVISYTTSIVNFN